MFLQRKTLSLVILAAAISSVCIGCQKSSHVSVSTYEYSEQGQDSAPPAEVVYERPTSDYRMVSPGQMTSPGQMAAPGEMAPPGRPVVEPRRSP